MLTTGWSKEPALEGLEFRAYGLGSQTRKSKLSGSPPLDPHRVARYEAFGVVAFDFGVWVLLGALGA